MRLTQFHTKFPGGVRWRVTAEGVELEGSGLLEYDAAILAATEGFLHQHGAECAEASRDSAAPVELLIALALTNSAGDHGKRFVWRQPGYVGDAQTPDLICAGVCRMALSMAQFHMKDPSIDHNWLLDVGNALRAAAREVRFHRSTLRTGWDPILTACACNAGGIYLDDAVDNPWRIRQYSLALGYQASPLGRVSDPSYSTRFSRYFAAALHLVANKALSDGRYVDFGKLIVGD